MTITIDHPKPEPVPEAPSYCMPIAERVALAAILQEQLREFGKSGRKESFGRFLDRINRKRHGRISPSAIKTFMMRDKTRLSTLDRLAAAFEIEGGHEALIDMARERAFEMGLYQNPQHINRSRGSKKTHQQLSLLEEEAS